MSRRRMWLGVLVVALVALLLAASLPRLLRPIAELWLRAELARRGVTQVQIGALDVAGRSARIDDLVLGGGDLRVEHIELRYGLSDLVRLRVGRVEVRGVRAQGKLGDEISLGAFGALAASALGGTGTGTGSAPRFRELRLEDARLELETPSGSIVVPADAEWGGDGAARTGSARFRVDSEQDRVRGSGSARYEGARWSAEAQLSARELDLGPSQLAALDLSLLAAGPPERLDGELSLELDGRLGGGLRTQLSLAARLRGSADGLVVQEMRCAPLRIEGELPGKLALRAPFASCLEGGGVPLLGFGGAGDEDGGVATNLVLRAAPLAGLLARNPRLAFEGESPRIELTGRWSAERGLRVTASAREGSMRISAAEVTASGFEADLEVAAPRHAAAGATTAKGTLQVAELRDDLDPPRFTPLSLSAQLERRSDELVGEARLDGAAGRLALRAAGTHDLAAGTGEARVSMEPLVFEPEKLTPGALSPRLGRSMRSATGRAELGGTLSWRGAELTSALDLVLHDVSLENDAAVVQGLETRVRVLRLWPPGSAPRQPLHVALIRAGLPVENATALFGVDAGRLVLDSAEGSLLGGTLRTAGVYDPALAENRIAVDVTDLDAARLVAELKLDALSATGLLGGRIPLVLREGSVFVEGGRLEAAPPGGTIRYAPPGASPLPADEQGVEMLLSALRDFRYQQLTMTLDGRLSGDLTVGLHLLGSNPDFFAGHPVAFNLNLDAPVAALVRSALVGLEIPEEIRRGIESQRSRAR